MFARGSSTRGQMKLPAIAQRGEGGVGGGSGESILLSKADHRRSVMPQKIFAESLRTKYALSQDPESASSYQKYSELTLQAGFQSRTSATGWLPKSGRAR